MELVQTLIDIVIHLDQHLIWLVSQYGAWTYSILFVIIFCETGLVVTPFLPGDSLLFAIGALAATGALNLTTLILLLAVAAILGDTVNYAVGNYIGPRVFRWENSRFFHKDHLERTHRFYEKYGGKTIIIARFVPIIRTFAPFVAGVGRMTYARFLTYNVVGGVGWILCFLLAGYFFGNIPIVKRNFTLVIFGIIFVSLMPGVIEYFRHRAERASETVAR